MLIKKTKEEYHSELASSEWGTRRKEILKRDNWVCQACLNKKYLADTFRISGFTSLVVLSTFENECTIELSSVKKSLRCQNKALENVPKGRKTKGYRTRKIGYAAFEMAEVPELQALFTIKPLGESLIPNEFGLSEDDIRVIAQVTPERIAWHYGRNLNIHHHYYKLGAKAWEYPDEALITYCHSCHTEVHDKLKIPVVDQNGQKLPLDLTPCGRCGGEGYIPEFDHVQSGICFECDGARYEELSPKFI